MDVERFDTLSRSLADPSSRRAALASLLGGTLGLVGLMETESKKKKKKKKKKQPPTTTQDPISPPPPPPPAPTCPDDRPVCGNGACCSPDRECGEFNGSFFCGCRANTFDCSNGSCRSTACSTPVDFTACSCRGTCEDGRPLCGSQCCPPTQVCQEGLTGFRCVCPAGTVECQPGFCASETCPNGQTRNPTTCVCPG